MQFLVMRFIIKRTLTIHGGCWRDDVHVGEIGSVLCWEGEEAQCTLIYLVCCLTRWLVPEAIRRVTQAASREIRMAGEARGEYWHSTVHTALTTAQRDDAVMIVIG